MNKTTKISPNEFIDIKESLIYLVNADKVFLRQLEKRLSTLPKTKIRSFITIKDCIKQLHNSPNLILISDNINKFEVENIVKITNQDYPNIKILFQ